MRILQFHSYFPLILKIHNNLIGDYLFVFYSLNDYAGNAFYANEKEPLVRPRFLMVEIRGFEPLTYALRTHRSTN